MKSTQDPRRQRLQLQPPLFRGTGRHGPGTRPAPRCHRCRGRSLRGCGLSVSVRKGELENVERNRDKGLSVTVYLGQRRGNASTSDFSTGRHRRRCRRPTTSRASPPKTRWPACPTRPTSRSRRAPRTRPVPPLGRSPASRPQQLALGCERPRLPPTAASATAKALRYRPSSRISSARTRTVSAAATPVRAIRSRCRPSRARRRHAARCLVQLHAQRQDLASPQRVGRYAAERALSRLGARKISTRQCPVLFESPLAAGLLGSLVQALSGGALYRQSSFLLIRWASRCCPNTSTSFRRPVRPARQGQLAV
jgi:PmbA protein